MSIRDFLKGEVGHTNVLYMFISKTLHQTKRGNSSFSSGIAICSLSSVIVICNLNSIVYEAMVQTCKLASIIHASCFQHSLLTPCMANM